MPLDPTLVGLRLRRGAARSSVRRAAVLALAAATGLVVVSLVSSAEAARDRWGRDRRVVVATRDLGPGEVIDGAAVEVRHLPEAAVGPRALAEVPAGSVVRQPIASGEAVVAARLAPEGLTGVAALVPAGHRAVAVATGPVASPPLAVGDRVDVLAVGAADMQAGDGEPAFTLVEGALVVDVGDQAISVAVPERDAARLAWVLTNGSAVLALSGS